MLIDQGHVADGLALMDEAMASVVAGEVSPYFTGIIYCSLIATCLMLSDLRRAGEWADAARSWCERIHPARRIRGCAARTGRRSRGCAGSGRRPKRRRPRPARS